MKTDSKSTKILIVDDRQENLYALKKTLSSLDCEIVTCTSGNDALATILDEQFALLLIDAQMPEMDGFETVLLLKQDPLNKDLPIIFISAIYQNEEYYLKAIKAGAVDFITKPVNSEILIGKIKVFLDLYESKMKLNHSVALNTAITNSSKHFINYSIDKNYKLISFNNSYKQKMEEFWNVKVENGINILPFSENPKLLKNYFDKIFSGNITNGVIKIKDSVDNINYYEVDGNPIITKDKKIVGLTIFLTNITEKKQIAREKEKLIAKLKTALNDVKTLRGMIPICASCKKIRTDEGSWQQLEEYIKQYADVSFSHGLCPDCARKLYPDYYDDSTED